MKKILFSCLLLISMGCFSQETLTYPTFKDQAFSKPLNKKKLVSQIENEGKKKRELIPYQMDGKEQLKQYLLNCYNDEGSVEESQYIISKQGIEPDFDLFSIPINTSNVLYFDGVLLNKREDENKNYKFYTIVKYQDKEVDMNTSLENYAVACENGGSQICEHWYFIITVDGDLASIDDLGEICTPCSGGGGGGSGSGGSGQPNDISCEDYANQGTAVSGSINLMGGTFNGDEFKQPINWLIFSDGPWGLLSYENTILKKVDYSGLKSRWEFERVTHNTIAIVGFTVGTGRKTFTDFGLTPNISETRMKVYLRMDFSVTTSKAVPYCSPVTIPYHSNKTHYAPNNIEFTN